MDSIRALKHLIPQKMPATGSRWAVAEHTRPKAETRKFEVDFFAPPSII